ncbi:MAG TPA: ABC transporter ATP-binding protein [Candidatus Nitrosotalea sp.]|nr:ABC transporter ATP-binding protein [Candidatus Nitrosotalea sp.]
MPIRNSAGSGNYKAEVSPFTKEVILRVENLTKIYDSASGRVVALSNINLLVKKGEFVSILGPSGSGKSTLLYMIGALDRPTSGKVYINGVDVFSLNDSEIAKVRNKMIGYVFQSYNLINRSSVLKNVELPEIIAGMSHDEADSRASRIMRALGIDEKARQKAVNLSGGQQQRVAIARALVNNPSIILADEPTGNLDTKTGGEVFDMLKRLTREFGRTVIIVTHDPSLAEMTDRSIFIRDGRVERETYHKLESTD